MPHPRSVLDQMTEADTRTVFLLLTGSNPRDCSQHQAFRGMLINVLPLHEGFTYGDVMLAYLRHQEGKANATPRAQ